MEQWLFIHVGAETDHNDVDEGLAELLEKVKVTRGRRGIHSSFQFDLRLMNK